MDAKEYIVSEFLKAPPVGAKVNLTKNGIAFSYEGNVVEIDVAMKKADEKSLRKIVNLIDTTTMAFLHSVPSSFDVSRIKVNIKIHDNYLEIKIYNSTRKKVIGEITTHVEKKGVATRIYGMNGLGEVMFAKLGYSIASGYAKIKGVNL